MNNPIQSQAARRAHALVGSLQSGLAGALEQVSADLGGKDVFEPVAWLRDGGRHGGGVRIVAGDSPIFDRASVNVSQVHYDDLPDRRLSSATALSTIVHPRLPRAPSMHMHISWTEMRDGRGYWRIMADLNPSIPDDAASERFRAALKRAAGATWEAGAAQGDRYFYIHAMGRHRGVVHFYLEQYATPDPSADYALARGVGQAVIEVYSDIVRQAARAHPVATPEDMAAQLAYHTMYLFQVLTLDRGTTSGLLVHDQNDVGIMGSLPSQVDTALLRSWRDLMPTPQEKLLDGLADALECGGLAGVYPVTEDAKRALAKTVRAHYEEHPEALSLQARGDVIPPTVQNHQE